MEHHDGCEHLELVGDTSYQVFPPGDRSEWGHASGMGPSVRSRHGVLVVAASRESYDLGARLADQLRAMQHEVTLARPDGAHPAAAGYSAVIVGDSWWSRWHPRSTSTYVRANAGTLATIPSGYFSIHGARPYEEDVVDDDEQFFRSVRWRPSHVLGIPRRFRLRFLMGLGHVLGVSSRCGEGSARLSAFAAALSARARR